MCRGDFNRPQLRKIDMKNVIKNIESIIGKDGYIFILKQFYSISLQHFVYKYKKTIAILKNKEYNNKS